MRGLAGFRDKFSNLARHLQGQDYGSVLPSTAAQIAASATHVNRIVAHPGGNATAIHIESMAAWNNRDDDMINKITRHVQAPGIVKQIDNLVKASVYLQYSLGQQLLRLHEFGSARRHRRLADAAIVFLSLSWEQRFKPHRKTRRQ